MRIPREIQLNELQSKVHMYWRCHNKEYLLKENSIKNLYLSSLSESLLQLKETRKSVIKIHSYCVMDNHFHQSISFENGFKDLSIQMQKSHTKFAMIFNKIKNRTGSFADGRPKTSLIQDERYEMQAHFYIEANPVRAGKIKFHKLKFYKFSSFKFYAYGIRDEFTSILTLPDWYLKLGRTQKERQRKYLKLFLEYLDLSIKNNYSLLLSFIGTDDWKIKMNNKIMFLLKNKKSLNSS